MSKNKKYLLALVVIFLGLSAISFSQYLYNWDAGQFALGLEHYAPDMHQPHPPGYPAFIALGKIFNLIFHNANFSLSLISLIFGLLAVLFLYFFLQKRIGFFAGLFLIVNPVFWFYRSIALTYTVDIFAVLFLVWAFYKNRRNNNYLYFSTAILGLIGGFRPTLIILLFPLYSLNYFYLQKNIIKKIIINLIIFSLSVLMWFVPMLYFTGGLINYLDTTQALFGAAAASTEDKWQQLKTFFGVLTVAINVLILPLLISAYLFFKEKKYNKIYAKSIFWITVFGLSPASFVYTFIHFGQPGYVLLLLPFLIILSLPGIKLLWRNKIGRIILIILLIIESFLFLGLTNKVSSPVTYDQTNIIERKISRLNPWLFKFNNYMIRNNDQKFNDLLKKMAAENSDDTFIIIARNLMYQADNGLTVRNDETFRQLMNYFSDYDIFEVAPNRDFYIQGNNYTTQNIFKPTVELDRKYKKVIFVEQQIDTKDLPTNLNLVKKQSYYQADLANIDEFEFLDFKFKF